MAYNELIKNFQRIRDYMRDFYVYGFKVRDQYGTKNSGRSYDNERRRIASWLGEYMSFYRDNDGKHVFLSVDSRTILHNPLYKAFKAKSFTANDVMLHFYLMDILQNREWMTLNEITTEIELKVESDSGGRDNVERKLKEYEKLGLIVTKKPGQKRLYKRNEDTVHLEKWKDAVSFFTEADPLGVMGAYLLDKYKSIPQYYHFKHHYILHALDSEILCKLLLIKSENHLAEIKMKRKNTQELSACLVYPSTIYISTQNGRQYLNAYDLKWNHMSFFRLDYIEAVTDKGVASAELETLCKEAIEIQKKHVWGVSNRGTEPKHLEMLIHVEKDEPFIVERLYRECRCGSVEEIDACTYLFQTDVYDLGELLPWIRTFTGRIIDLTCDDKKIEETFENDFEEMKKMYEVK